MTDNEIINSLERTASWVCDECKFNGEMCDGNKCEKVIADNALDLINRQKAEIERLKDELHRAKVEISKHFDYMDEAANEAIDFFASCLKIKLNRMIDNLVKEMTEGKNE